MANVRHIGFLLYEGCTLLDCVGPAEVFGFVQHRLGMQGCRDQRLPKLFYFSPDGGDLTTSQGLPVLTQPTAQIGGCELDTLIVVGSTDAEGCDSRIPECIAECSGSIRRIASVCTGAFLLARAGVLDGRKAVTHWHDCEALRSNFPAVKVDPDCIFVEDRGVWTSAGLCAGIDMALAMVEQDYGPEVSMSIARAMVVFLKRPGGQAQLSMTLSSQNVAGPIGELLKWILRHPDEDLRAELLARRAHMSLRNFYRAFEEKTGTSPAHWVEATRLELATRLLEQTSEYGEQIALKSGFTTYERMRRAFIRRYGASPLAYRGRFSAPLQKGAPLHAHPEAGRLVIEPLSIGN